MKRKSDLFRTKATFLFLFVVALLEVMSLIKGKNEVSNQTLLLAVFIVSFFGLLSFFAFISLYILEIRKKIAKEERMMYLLEHRKKILEYSKL